MVYNVDSLKERVEKYANSQGLEVLVSNWDHGDFIHLDKEYSENNIATAVTVFLPKKINEEKRIIPAIHVYDNDFNVLDVIKNFYPFYDGLVKYITKIIENPAYLIIPMKDFEEEFRKSSLPEPTKEAIVRRRIIL